MSRWHLASSREMHEAARILCADAGLRTSGERVEPHCHLQVYGKRAVETETFADCGRGDWICAAGTLIYDGQLGEPALRAAFADYAAAGIASLRDHALGHYAVAVRRGGEIMVFTDPLGTLSLYHATSSRGWIVSNSLHVCAGALPQRRLDPLRFVVAALDGTSAGESTFYRDVRRLFGTQALRLDPAHGTLAVCDLGPTPRAPALDVTSLASAVADYADRVGSVFAEIARTGPLALLGTGGLDSRTVLAALLDVGARPRLMYAVGNSRLTDQHPRDLELARRIAAGLRLPFRQLDWSGDQPHDLATLQRLFRTYGFQSEVHGAPRGLLDTLAGAADHDPGLWLCGRGPVLTQKQPWAVPQAAFSLDQLVEFGMSRVVCDPAFLHPAAYRSERTAAVREALDRGGIRFPDVGATRGDFVRAFAFIYLRSDARFLNLASEFRDYLTPFMLARLHEPLAALPPEFRLHDEFQVRLIDRLVPRLLGFPLLSARQEKRIDRRTFRVMREERRTPVGRLAAAVLPRTWFDRVEAAHRRRRAAAPHASGGSAQERAIIREYGAAVLADPLLAPFFAATDPLEAGARIKILARLRQQTVGVEMLGYTVDERRGQAAG
ncbi:MAG: hypothetical protein R3D98_09845 [Candidatus Krumholzibacteriia bacterium]